MFAFHTVVRAPISTLNRRASLGSIGKMPSRNAGQPVLQSRVNVTRSNSTEPVNVPSKLSLARQAISGGRSCYSTAKGSTENPTTGKRSTPILRRISSPAAIPNGTKTNTSSLAMRKTVATTKLASLPLASKLAKK